MAKLSLDDLMGKSVVKILPGMIVNKRKKSSGTVRCKRVLLAVMMVLGSLRGSCCDIAVEPERPHCQHVTVGTSLPDTRTLNNWRPFAKGSEVWETMGGWAQGSHLILTILCRFYSHVSFISDWGVAPATQLRTSSFLPPLVQEPVVPLKWEVTSSGCKGSPQ